MFYPRLCDLQETSAESFNCFGQGLVVCRKHLQEHHYRKEQTKLMVAANELATKQAKNAKADL